MWVASSWGWSAGGGDLVVGRRVVGQQLELVVQGAGPELSGVRGVLAGSERGVAGEHQDGVIVQVGLLPEVEELVGHDAVGVDDDEDLVEDIDDQLQPGAVVVRERVAHAVVADGLTGRDVVRLQQLADVLDQQEEPADGVCLGVLHPLEGELEVRDAFGQRVEVALGEGDVGVTRVRLDLRDDGGGGAIGAEGTESGEAGGKAGKPGGGHG